MHFHQNGDYAQMTFRTFFALPLSGIDSVCMANLRKIRAAVSECISCQTDKHTNGRDHLALRRHPSDGARQLRKAIIIIIRLLIIINNN